MSSAVVRLPYLVFQFLLIVYSQSEHHRDLAWTGGPLHLDCEYGADFFARTGQHISENVVATKAFSFKDDVYVVTPRLKHGVLATIWMVTEGRKGPELQAFPDLKSHSLADCNALQNSVDSHLDHFGNLWILDTGVIETLSAPQCTCPPKVLVINMLFEKVVKTIDLTPIIEPTSSLQNIAVEYCLDGKEFVYISDASRGAVLVYDVAGHTGWSVRVAAPGAALQLGLIRRGLADSALVLIRVPYQGILELDTAILRRKHSSPITVFGEHAKPMLLLGTSPHHVFVREAECGCALSWDARRPFNASALRRLHAAPPALAPAALTHHPLRRLLLLDSDYARTVYWNLPTYHRVTFIHDWS